MISEFFYKRKVTSILKGYLTGNGIDCLKEHRYLDAEKMVSEFLLEYSGPLYHQGMLTPEFVALDLLRLWFVQEKLPYSVIKSIKYSLGFLCPKNEFEVDAEEIAKKVVSNPKDYRVHDTLEIL